MGKVKFTKDQQRVIDLRNCNILVSAAAGSGKTAVLVERILHKLTDQDHPVDIDRLLVVTFTDAAAGEMRERISKRIEEQRLLEPDNPRLERQAALVHNAQITTIHSFCLGILKNYFNEIDLDPGFRLGDETELKLLKADIMERVLEEFYTEAAPDFLALIESYATGKRDESIEKMVYRLYDFAMSYPWPRQWIERQRESFQADNLEEFQRAGWQKELVGFLKAQLSDCLEENKAALSITEEPDGPYMYEAALLEDKEQLLLLSQAETYEEIGRLLSAFSFARLPGKKDDSVNPDKKEQAKLLRDGIKKEIKELQEKYFFQSQEEMLLDVQRVRPAMMGLLDLTLAFMEAYENEKAEKNLLDFNDLEHFALKILVEEPSGDREAVPTEIAVELSEYYEEILIDEYQDSNLVQETLLNSISREKLGQPNVFMVGDVKQSIYKFRLARPELFMKKYESYQQEGDYVRVDLKKNFRSREKVLEAINYIFYGIMKKDLGNIEYDEAAALYVGREEEKEYVGGEDCEIMILQSSDEVSNQELEARAIAGRMKELHKAGVAYSDMAVLLRSMKGWSEEIVGVLKEEGIPAKATTQTGYFSATEVALILNLLLIIDNPLQDIPLASVLRSPIGGFTDEELADLRCLNREGSLYDCVVECISEAATSSKVPGRTSNKTPNRISDKAASHTSDKAAQFLTLLEELRSLVPFVGIYELLSVIYEKTGYYNYAKALPGGAARCANLDMLLEKGAAFERTSYGGLFQFNRYIERLHRYEVDFGEAEALGENQDTVTIMSIHKSKGLEFPVVFLAGMGKNFNKQDTRERILLHPDLGIGPDYIDSTLRTKSPTLLKQVIKRRSELESIGEELRVLYVAMTRARDKLYLTGCVKETEKAMARWTQGKLLLFSQRAGAASFFDFIMPRVLLWQECEPVCESERKPGSGEGARFLVTYLTEEELTFETVAEKISKESQRMELLALERKTVWSEEEMDKAEAILSYTYPYKKEKEIKSKFTVSELKRMSYQEEEEVPLWQSPASEAYVPLFAREDKEMTGSFRGTVYHRILEQISFVAARTEGLSTELNRLIEKKRLTKEEEKLVSKQKLSRFLTSGLGKRLQVAEGKGLLHREQPFVIGCLASQVQPRIDSEETVLVQGVIDCFFEEEKGLVLVDYKTDRVAGKTELVEKYKSQMDYYRQALEQLTGKPVVEAYLYSFHLGEEIRIDG